MMKETILIFAGTVEGRELAEFCSRQNIDAHVCVATEYGEELVEHLPGIHVHMGRMDQPQMKGMMEELRPSVVIDATHPYADLVTRNIAAAAGEMQIPCLRLLRQAADLEKIPGVILVENAAEAAAYLEKQEGNVFLTTGLKELPVFAKYISDKSRIYARVLLQQIVFEKMEELGLSRQQIICMQGPFSKELNLAMFAQTKAAFVVTKESGAAGGFMEKIEAARELGLSCIVIRRPVREEGMTAEQIRQYLCPDVVSKEKDGENSGRVSVLSDNSSSVRQDDAEEKTGMKRNVSPSTESQHKDNQTKSSLLQVAELPDDSESQKRTVTLLGIGMGAESSMTVEAVQACQQADLIIGAKRMLETLKQFQKPMAAMYLSQEIRDYILQHPEYRRFVIGLSGDVGFYSGSKKLIQALEQAEEDLQIRQICGISSVMYMAAKLKMPWEDMALCSAHGRQQNLVSAVRRHAKTFCLVSDAASVRELADLLCRYGLAQTTMHVGVDLSYPTERMFEGKTETFLNFDAPGICAVVLENEDATDQVITHGIPDEEFLRDKVPMTKEEVRSVALSKLRLTRDAVVYDVGSGTGSVSIECALLADQGRVYAIERKEEALALTEKNRKKFGVPNVITVSGLAPEALADLPAPTHAFIGGSGGNLKEIIAVLRQKNPAIRIVITCIAMDTAAEAMELLKTTDPAESEICTVNVARSKTLGSYHMMMGQNPVTIFTLQYKEPKDGQSEF